VSNMLNTALDFMGFLNTDEDDGFEIETRSKKNNKKNISMVPKMASTIIHITPKAFEDVIDIVKMLKDNTIVTINLALVDVAISKRIIDFASGAVYALEGGVMKMADNVYLFAGRGVTLQKTDSSDFPWTKESE